jgi:protein-S-isoprenylcysteine O-methyltransferase Ste14
MDDLFARLIRATVGGTAVFLGIIFIPAGTIDYWQAWALVGTLLASSLLVTVYMALNDRGLLESRLRMGPTAETTATQKTITAVGFAVFVAALVLMVLDHRFGWSPRVPASLSLLGDAIAVAGIAIYYFVIRENRYAASTVTVVEGQTVISTGPYAIVRHPMYSGAILVFLAIPLALGSWWGVLLTPLFIGWFVWRLLDEERFLGENLRGYDEYKRMVRARLVPMLW